MNYLRIYENIVEKALVEGRVKGAGIYYENHHIVPNCWCVGELKYLKSDKRNLVLLTGEEHFLAHYYLSKSFPKDSKLSSALWGMCNQSNKFQEREYDPEIHALIYQEAKEAYAKVMSERIISEETLMKMRKPKSEHHVINMSKSMKKYYENGGIHHMQDKKQTEESKEKMREKRNQYYENGGINPMQDKKQTEESKKQMSISANERIERIGSPYSNLTPEQKEKHLNRMNGTNNPGKNKSEETKKKIGEATRTQNQKKIKCPHCDKISDIRNIKRWHFDNCKHKKVAV
jgi:hypothetical protein